MSMEEFGIFNWMLMHSWVFSEKPCHLPNDPVKIAWLLRIDNQLIINCLTKYEKWEKTGCGKYIYNPRLLSIYESLVDRSKIYAVNRLGKFKSAKKQLIINCKTIDNQADNDNDIDNSLNSLNSLNSKNQSDIMNIYNYWNSKENIPKHRKLTSDMVKNLDRVLKECPATDMEACIDNYARILGSSEDYLGKYPHALDDFFRKGANKPSPYKKFLSGCNPIKNLLIRRKESEYL
jgi:hypothetical protein